MKQNGSTITLLSLFIVAFWSCVSRPDEIVTTLQRAESCMEMYPDSAWHLLSGISDPDDLSDKKRADYVLLLTQARDKNYMDMSVDSSITFAVDYFKKNGNKRKYGKALYYYGRVLQGKRETSRAMKTFLDARQLWKKRRIQNHGTLTDISILIVNNRFMMRLSIPAGWLLFTIIGQKIHWGLLIPIRRWEVLFF